MLHCVQLIVFCIEKGISRGKQKNKKAGLCYIIGSMPIIGSYILPHPPFCVPEVGRGKEKAAEKTVASLIAVAKEIAALEPDTIVFISPHSEAYRDFFPIADGEVGICNFSAYGVQGLNFRLFYDRELIKEIADAAKQRNISAGPSSGNDNASDHGTLVPL